MGYMLPLKFIRVSEHMSICATRIVAIMSYKSYVCKRLVKDERNAGTLLNAAGRDKIRSAIVLDNGTIVASSFDVGRILTNINHAGAKRTDSRAVKVSSAVKVYDVLDDDLLNEMLEEYPEMSSMTRRREALPDEAYEPEEDGEIWSNEEDYEDEEEVSDE